MGHFSELTVYENLDNFDGNTKVRQNAPKFTNPFTDLPGNVYVATVMGGYKELRVDVTVSGSTVTLTYTFTDVFGVGADDSKKDWPGVAAMYFCSIIAEYGEYHIRHLCGVPL